MGERQMLPMQTKRTDTGFEGVGCGGGAVVGVVVLRVEGDMVRFWVGRR